MLKRVIVPVVALAIGAGGYYFNTGAKNCRSLTDLSNSAVAAANAATTEAQFLALPAALDAKSAEMRSTADDYDDPFKSDARQAASDLDKISAAIRAKDEKAYDGAIDRYNADVDTINKHCEEAG